MLTVFRRQSISIPTLARYGPRAMPSEPTQEPARNLELADLAMLLVVVIWGSNNVLTKAALDDGLEPLIYVAARFAIVAVVFWIVLTARGAKVRIRRSDLPRFIGSGVLGFALYNMLFVIGLAHTSAFSAAILIALAPIFMLVISALLGLEQVRMLQWVGVFLSLVGVGIFIGEKLLAGEPALGDMLNVVAALSFAFYGLTTRDLVIRYGPAVTTAWSVTVGLVAIVPFVVTSIDRSAFGEVDQLGWISILYAAIVSMMLAYSLWGWAIARTGAGRSVPYLFLIPVFTGVFAFLFRDERLGTAQLTGGMIALAGVALARMFARPANRPAPALPAEETGMAPAAEPKQHAISST
ncbi:MAG: DMT family transporter [Thermomicrobiales bacterium]|nr:DMT family transporter [Thermomicrobiales bacterium]